MWDAAAAAVFGVSERFRDPGSMVSVSVSVSVSFFFVFGNESPGGACAAFCLFLETKATYTSKLCAFGYVSRSSAKQHKERFRFSYAQKLRRRDICQGTTAVVNTVLKSEYSSTAAGFI